MNIKFKNTYITDDLQSIDLKNLKVFDQVVYFDDVSHEKNCDLNLLKHMVLNSIKNECLYIFTALPSCPTAYYDKDHVKNEDYEWVLPEDAVLEEVDFDRTDKISMSYLQFKNKKILQIADNDRIETTITHSQVLPPVEGSTFSDSVQRRIFNDIFLNDKHKIPHYGEFVESCLEYQDEVGCWYYSIPLNDNCSLVISLEHRIRIEEYRWNVSTAVELFDKRGEIHGLNLEVKDVISFLKEHDVETVVLEDFNKFRNIFNNSEFSISSYLYYKQKEMPYDKLEILKEAFKQINFDRNIERFLKPCYCNDKFGFATYVDKIQTYHQQSIHTLNGKVLSSYSNQQELEELKEEVRKGNAMFQFFSNNGGFNPQDGCFYKNRVKNELNVEQQSRVLFKNHQGLIFHNASSYRSDEQLTYYLNFDGYYVPMDKNQFREVVGKLEIRKAYALSEFLNGKTPLNPVDGKCYRKNQAGTLEVSEDLQRLVRYKDAEGLIYNDIVYVVVGDYYLQVDQNSQEEEQTRREILERKKLVDELTRGPRILPIEEAI